MTRRMTASRLPASIPRDLLLHRLHKHEPILAGSMTLVNSRYVRSRKRIVVTFEFDPDEYLRLADG